MQWTNIQIWKSMKHDWMCSERIWALSKALTMSLLVNNLLEYLNWSVLYLRWLLIISYKRMFLTLALSDVICTNSHLQRLYLSPRDALGKLELNIGTLNVSSYQTVYRRTVRCFINNFGHLKYKTFITLFAINVGCN